MSRSPANETDAAVATVYVEAGVSDSETDAGARRRLVHTARACRHLREFGYPVVLLGRDAEEACHGTARLRPRRLTLDTLPEDAGGWLVSDDPDTCARARRHTRLRTVHVGPRTPGAATVERPADVQARNLLDAVLTIVAEEAMGGD